MKNFKEKAIEFQKERDELIEIINIGIIKFNNINKTRVETLDEDIDYMSGYDTPINYVCGENGIRIIWFENIGRCGSTEYEKNSQLIPYAYFEEDDKLDAINKDIERRKKIEYKLSEVQREKISLNSKRLDLEKEIRELHQVKTKYEIDTSTTISEKETELVKCKENLNNKEKQIQEIKNEL